ncbi:DUF1189 domain-containing protein [Neobacillus sp. PS3-40]|jgi:hypothetical protein|uniref:DUF1189 domain-containing protein n=1 Tax=Neobacillus sp. PS3-40 TaxID=3070679 RepID=UPI0027E0BA53|nr:DUF1189 domain-containing protein [Neobacillus sp. PS3-40]WML45322.1 DUF1189 domain-containing protein [Neobacillus sp. PS3-40]
MNIFKQFYKSIYSPKDIAVFRFQGIGKTILFVFLLTLLSILPSVYFLSTAISSGLDTTRSIIKDEVPSFSIHDGQLHAKTSVPITVNKKNFTIILDPTGVITEKKLDETNNGFALLKNEFVLITGGRTEIYPYSMLNTIKVSNRDILDFLDVLNGIKLIIIPVISIFIYLFSSASNFIEISILALLGLGIKNLAGRRLTYRQLWRMAAYSETLPTLFFTIMAAIKTTVPNSFLINWVVAIIVLFLAINEIPKPKKTV